MKKISSLLMACAVLLATISCSKDEKNSEVGDLEHIHLSIDGKDFSIPMVRVQGGTFKMADAHPVTLSDYYIGQYEMTQELWNAVMGSNPSHYQEGAQYPVECVTWNEIVNVFLPKLNQLSGRKFMLPTEAQWEFAARGGRYAHGFKYSGSNVVDLVACCLQNQDPESKCQPLPVGSKSPNELGIYDMSGNVAEWCADWYGEYDFGAQTDPRGPQNGIYRVFRGGHYRAEARFCQVSERQYDAPNMRYDTHGFRLVLPK